MQAFCADAVAVPALRTLHRSQQQLIINHVRLSFNELHQFLLFFIDARDQPFYSLITH